MMTQGVLMIVMILNLFLGSFPSNPLKDGKGFHLMNSDDNNKWWSWQDKKMRNIEVSKDEKQEMNQWTDLQG